MESVLKKSGKESDIKKKTLNLKFKLNKKTAPYYFIAPAVVLFSLFTIYPF